MSSIFTYTDTGINAYDGFTKNGTVTLTLAVDTITWDYSLDNGTSWTAGTGSSFLLPEGSYAKANILVKQFDTLGNSSIVAMNTMPATPFSPMVQLEAIGRTSGADTVSQITSVGTIGEYVVTFQGVDSAGDYSIFVQKFNTNGTVQGSMVQLEAMANTTGADYLPQITSVGTTGAYVVTFYGVDSANDSSIFVQKFNANGTISGSMVQLEAIGNATGVDNFPQITSVGTAGEYVVTFNGADSAGDISIFTQKFNAYGTIQGSMTQLEAIGNTTRQDSYPQITAVGTAGEYVVTFYGIDSLGGDNSIFVQKFNADGTIAGSMVQLEAIGKTNGSDLYPQIASVGMTGEYVVTFYGKDSANDDSIFVQKFNANGTIQGSMVQLEAIGTTNGADLAPQITAVGTAGEYVVTFTGVEWDTSIFVQKFNTDGTTQGSMVQLEAIGRTNSTEMAPQITAVGSVGEYVVTFYGFDSAGDNSIFVQKFNADGTIQGSMVQLEAISLLTGSDQAPQITAVGTVGEYVVTFYGVDSAGDNSIFVQKFSMDGTIVVDISTAVPIINTIATDNIINSAEKTAGVAISGTAEAGSSVAVTLGAVTQTVTANATTGVYTTTFVTANIPTDTVSTDITVVATDLLGNISTTATQAVAINTTPPTILTINTIATDSIINSTEKIAGVVISGTAEADSSVAVTLGDNTQTVTANATTGVYTTTFVTANIPADTASTNVTVVATDLAGNMSATATQGISIDTTPPAIMAASGLTYTDTGTSATDGITANGTVTLALSVDTVTWDYSLDNGISWTVGAGNSFVLPDGTYDKQNILVEQFDAAGNSSISAMDSMVQLEAIGNTIDYDDTPQITAVGTTGEYVVTFTGTDSAGDSSIFVQKFNANGTMSGSMVQLEAISVTNGYDSYPQITAVGTAGEYIVTFTGTDGGGDNSIFVQKFDANGTSGPMVQLEAISNAIGFDYYPQITTVGSAGEYVVTFQGIDSAGDYSIFVQKFNANGTMSGSMVQLEAIGKTNGYDYYPQITTVGSAGEYVVTFTGDDSAGYSSIFVQKFDVNGVVLGPMVQLEAIGNTTGTDQLAQIITVGTAGEYVVTFQGIDSAGDYSIFVQKFNANGTMSGSMVQLEAIGAVNGWDYEPQITAVGTAGEYVVTFTGEDSTSSESSIFVQKFNANGTMSGSMVQLEAIGAVNGWNYEPQITAVGTAGEYVVTFTGEDSAGYSSIFVQKFNADGTIGTIVVDSSLVVNNAPTITSIATATIAENAATFTVLYMVTATDVDASTTLTYSLSGTDAALLTINSTTGEVTLKASADYETKNSYLFNVIASNGDLSATQGITATITDVNDAPEGLVTISGMAVVGQTLSVSDTLTDQDGMGTVAYQWIADGIAIAGATNTTLELGAGDRDKTIAVIATYTDTKWGLQNVIGLATSPVTDSSRIGNIKNNIVKGTSGNDLLDGGADGDIMLGSAGNDTYIVEDVRDRVYETITANSSDNTDSGGTDLVISSVSFTLGKFIENLYLKTTNNIDGTGNSMNNVIYAGDGNNILDGATGIDILSYYYTSAAVEVTLGSTSAQVTGGSGSDTVKNFENLTGSNYADVLSGNNFNNTVNGGLGNDTLTGGTGNDIFVFDSTFGNNIDTITDFSATDDTIWLDNAIFTQLTVVGTLSAANFISNATGEATDAAHYIIYNISTGALSYDADGSGTGNSVQIAILGAITHPTNITNVDFVVI